MSRNILITGGAGFIGSHVVRLFVTKYPDYRIVNLDKLTYAGNLANLKDIEQAENYSFERCDICDYEQVLAIFRKYRIDGVIHLAAESHVDRSIKDPFTFARTNVMGTLSLLQAARVCWDGDWAGKLFYHISTDEVYGALQFDGTLFTETTKYDPHSPYSASKASSDHFVRAFHDTYGMPTLVTNCSNNYGPYQFPEKLIPLFINNIRHGKPLPVYGRGENVRDWLYVVDHARAIDTIFHRGKVGDTYNIGGFNEWRNIDLIRVVIRTVDRLLGRSEGASEHLITYVTDRAGHDLRYAIDSRKLKEELGWEPSLQFEEGIEKTVRWYLDNQEWMDNITSGEYEKYYEEMYRNRLRRISVRLRPESRIGGAACKSSGSPDPLYGETAIFRLEAAFSFWAVLRGYVLPPPSLGEKAGPDFCCGCEASFCRTVAVRTAVVLQGILSECFSAFLSRRCFGAAVRCVVRCRQASPTPRRSAARRSS